MLLDEKQIAKELTIAILEKLNFSFFKDDDSSYHGEELYQKAGQEVSNLYKMMCQAVSEGKGTD
ncbi:hypothetical protein [Paenibacillus radicis (ex Xue et al. 2023)]|uniref:Uncharacterized protein n=1 Tax=Paenibacillus radicis (ex Xue et al. 2023) TaxID=2972489 RepID=A0ABT1YJS2_9BACL|nr:hypothetical protein [Paenibacillus radicis (ex Xue et al. 2023)]MCR8633446.1 hypothetical protein [Paenibacillus radicis (ex Xue et al. 2023)]